MPELPAGPTTWLAFDPGRLRTGVAIGNDLTCTARPLEVIATAPTTPFFERIGALIAEWDPGGLVVGRPLDADGQVQEMTRHAERLARRLGGRFGRPVVLVDERYSSAQARIDRRGDPQADRREPLDGLAAAIILQQYLSTRQS